MLLVLGFITWIILTACLNGWAASILWGWFVVPFFVGAPELTVPLAIGLNLVISRFIASGSVDLKDQSTYLYGILGPLLVLGMGLIVKLFLGV